MNTNVLKLEIDLFDETTVDTNARDLIVLNG